MNVFWVSLSKSAQKTEKSKRQWPTHSLTDKATQKACLSMDHGIQWRTWHFTKTDRFSKTSQTLLYKVCKSKHQIFGRMRTKHRSGKIKDETYISTVKSQKTHLDSFVLGWAQVSIFWVVAAGCPGGGRGRDLSTENFLLQQTLCWQVDNKATHKTSQELRKLLYTSYLENQV